MKKVAISSEKSKNKDRECVYTEPSLKVNIVYNGKRIKKNRNFRRGKQFNALRRCVPYSVVLPKTSSEKYFATSNILVSDGQDLPSNGTDACNNLRSNLRDSSNKQNKDTTRKWFFPTNNWIKNLMQAA